MTELQRYQCIINRLNMDLNDRSRTEVQILFRLSLNYTSHCYNDKSRTILYAQCLPQDYVYAVSNEAKRSNNTYLIDCFQLTLVSISLLRINRKVSVLCNMLSAYWPFECKSMLMLSLFLLIVLTVEPVNVTYLYLWFLL